MRITKPIFATTLLIALTSCGGGGPSKTEVKKILIEQGVQQAFLFQNPTQQQRDQAIATLEKRVDLQGLNCKSVEGFKKVWDCTVNYMLNGAPQTDKMRFYRNDKGDLAISDTPNGNGE
ncbi:hypothetical protein Gbth_038_006 [Gluconobacter thailandicus F149-1 = NBRC 100600]|uniref:hypothetical protein n=1 Tax=Gluconobacter thailandicus TaxID=257438 RepID=UPI000554AE84|nr:hypothetical protein [Gluconobacter thailandicus]KXV54895.1 hypothetical protein AD946_01045 [Gluconobacter thailandicus]GAN93858.1 hypothetical protein Gbth_038_006 [Gluconobacter thailandicus F149-1 = NBRC 100600]GBR60080.1 hypothetical protein AA100600_1702 [Gluconobacter thailandicus F149-1 = NBRC 100600]GEL88578.1 hypothetical protein GTH01_29360 [Gluconobacter thailandicus F149-1 = NBRC 100600]